MVVLNLDGHIFFRHRTVFHLVRDNIYSPWEIIGVGTVHPDHHKAWYVPGYEEIEKNFKLFFDGINSPHVRASEEALDDWRKQFVSLNNVVSPVINLYSHSKKFYDVGHKLYKNVVQAGSLRSFSLLLLMLKMKKEYFSCIFNKASVAKQTAVNYILEKYT